jgi:ribosome biogenesis GTPase A
MVKGMKDMQKRLEQIDCLLEVHDARIPLSGRNRDFAQGMAVVKPHLLLLNKKDLTDRSHDEEIEKRLKLDGVSKVVWTDLSGRCPPKESNFTSILPTLLQMVMTTDRFNRSDCSDINVMVIGIPNVGKSCLINRLRQKHLGKSGSPAKSGAVAGVTRHVMEKIKICDNPKVYILDTPGILEPNYKNAEQYMKLALVSSSSDHVVGVTNIADYALYWMNRNGFDSYVKYFNLEKATDNLIEVLLKICIDRKYTFITKDLATKQKVVKPRLENAAEVFIKAFRTGELGSFLLDSDLLKKRHKINIPSTSNGISEKPLPFAND